MEVSRKMSQWKGPQQKLSRTACTGRVKLQRPEGKMESESKKAWQALCEQAAKEQNPERLMVLVREISRLLDEQLKPPHPRDAA
jgi:hypothetical protein